MFYSQTNSKRFKHGELNSQNCRYWSKENLHLCNVTRTQYPEMLKVRAGIINSYINGSFFINGTLNSTKYLELLHDRIMPALNGLNLEGPIWYQPLKKSAKQKFFAQIVRKRWDL